MAPKLSWQLTSWTSNCASSMALSCSDSFEALSADDEHALFRPIWPGDQLDDTCSHIGRGGRRGHALDKIGRGNAEIAGIAGDRMLAELRVRHHARRERQKPQAQPKAIGFLLAVIGHEDLGAFCAGISAGVWRARKRRARGDQDDRAPRREWRRQRGLHEMKGDLDVALPVNGELLPVLLMKGCGGRTPPRGAHQENRA